MHSTIFALATPVGGALSVIRISGPEAASALAAVFDGNCQTPRHMALGKLRAGALTDAAMAVRFVSPHSYTGEDMAELYLHGGLAVTQAALAALAAHADPAEPGEFTRRAFLNGKLDLSQAEAVMDVIRAGSESAAVAAAEQLSGSLGARVRALEESLTDLLSLLNAAIDYPEEMDEDAAASLPKALSEAEEALRALVENGLRARVLREGARLVLTGVPNAGKSSLLNALLGYARAIVTDDAGTTRDVLEESAVFSGVPVRLTDTAGLREGKDEAEKLGVARAKQAVDAADLLLCCVDVTSASASGLTAADRALLAETSGRARIVVLCKGDAATDEAAMAALRSQLTACLRHEAEATPILTVSAHTGEGIEALREAVAQRLAPPESPLVTNARHIDALTRAHAAVESAQAALDAECAATDLREALLCLGEITGQSVDETVIERIFANFCVGK